MRGKECERQCTFFLGKYKGGNTVISEVAFAASLVDDERTYNSEKEWRDS